MTNSASSRLTEQKKQKRVRRVAALTSCSKTTNPERVAGLIEAEAEEVDRGHASFGIFEGSIMASNP